MEAKTDRWWCDLGPTFEPINVWRYLEDSGVVSMKRMSCAIPPDNLLLPIRYHSCECSTVGA